MSQYLGLPLFDFSVNWLNPLTKRFAYDLGEQSSGFGSTYFTALTNNTAQGWDLTLDLPDADAIKSVESFFDSLLGPFSGFWFPSQMNSMRITSMTNTHDFRIVYQGLSLVFDEDEPKQPELHLMFFHADGTTFCQKVLSVEDLGDGHERIVMTAAVTGLDVGSVVNRLHYVRLSGDEEVSAVLSENYLRKSLKIVELPEEYAQQENGSRPIYLYHLWAESPVGFHWRYTSFASQVSSGGYIWNPFPMTHGAMQDNLRGDANSLDLEAMRDDDHPFSLFTPIPISAPVNVEVLKVSYLDLPTQSKLFVGQVRTVEDRGVKMIAHCDSFLTVLLRKIPRQTIGPDCQNQLYDLKTCKAPRWLYEVGAVIDSLPAFDWTQPPRVVLTFTIVVTDAMKAADYFAQGYIQSGYGLNFESRAIVNSSWNAGTSKMTLTLNAPLRRAELAGDVRLAPGCDGLRATCKLKFNNDLNFGGFPFVPVDNPTVASVNNDTAAGGKK